ncbi:hypothetical protein [Aminobacter phage Erebus]|nr:hypothetical protein [Aminobacter phage Erebus]
MDKDVIFFWVFLTMLAGLMVTASVVVVFI